LIKAHYAFPSELEELGKRATIITIGRALWRFKHALNKFYVQPGVSPLNRFGFITPNEWNSLQQLHTTPEIIALSSRMKELIQKNKFKHILEPSGYKATIPLWTKNEQKLCEAGIPDPLEGCMLRTRNWIQCWSHTNDIGQLVTSNSDITRVIENAKDLIAKEKANKFKPQGQKDQLSVALETEEHWGCTWAISSIASWKEGFTEDIHMYKRRGRYDKDVESTNNDEDRFATLFFNFMKKHQDIIISQVFVPQINLDISTRFTLSNASSAPDQQKYHVDDINEPTPCTLLYVKCRTLRTIKVVDTIVIATRIMHGQPIPSKCALVDVTMIREGHEFEDLDYPYEEEEIEKLKDAKGNFILWPHKDIILKIIPRRLFHHRI
jgi:hypothetical protein